jgi:SEC-C motif
MSIRDHFPPADPCPCGSNKKAKNCCLFYMRKWKKRPASTTPQGESTSYSHPKCYARTTHNCSTKISAEHYISDGILRKIQLNHLVKVGGLPGNKNKMQLLPRARMASRILCQRHNSSLSPLDTEGEKFKNSIGYFDRGFNNENPSEEILLLAGEDVEKWLLKTACGMLAAGKFGVNGEATSQPLPEKWVRILWGLENWPKYWGLYVPLKGVAYHSDSLSVIPLTNPVNNEILAVKFEINGLPINLVLGTPDNLEAWGTYRPRTLIFHQRGVNKYLELSWQDNKNNDYVFFDRQIPYDGPPPDWPEWMRE